MRCVYNNRDIVRGCFSAESSPIESHVDDENSLFFLPFLPSPEPIYDYCPKERRRRQQQLGRAPQTTGNAPLLVSHSYNRNPQSFVAPNRCVLLLPPMTSCLCSWNAFLELKHSRNCSYKSSLVLCGGADPLPRVLLPASVNYPPLDSAPRRKCLSVVDHLPCTTPSSLPCCRLAYNRDCDQ